jgi:hypothetical protein
MAFNRNNRTFTRFEVRNLKRPETPHNELGELLSWSNSEAEARLVAASRAHEGNKSIEVIEASYKVISTYDRSSAIEAFNYPKSDPG